MMKKAMKYPYGTAALASGAILLALFTLVAADVYSTGVMTPVAPTQGQITLAWMTAGGSVLQAIGWAAVLRRRVGEYWEEVMPC